MSPARFNRLVEITRALYPLHTHNSGRCFHTCFILKSGKILTIGINNSNKTHAKNLKFDYFAKNGTDLRHEIGIHAEMSAIIRGRREDYSDYTFVNIRINSEGKTLFSAPCRGCSSIFRQTGYKKIYYTTENGFDEYILT